MKRQPSAWLEKVILFLFFITLAGALYFTIHDGFKKGPWILTAGLFFLWLFYREIQQKE
jgi:hypothetical protein